MPISSALLETPLDLSITSFVEPAPGILLAATRMTSGRATLAGAFAVACGVCLFVAWRQRAEVLDMLWPWGLLAPVFGLVALAAGFGHDRRTYDARARTVRLNASLGPLRLDRTVDLPKEGLIRVVFTLEQGSRAGGKATPSVRRYDVDVAGKPELSFTVAGDRVAARDAAKRLSALLGYPIKDEAEDDGVERLPKDAPPS